MPKAKIINEGLTDTWGRKNRTIPDKSCEVCGKIFRPVDSKKRTCSRECGYKIRKLTPHNKGKGKGWINPKGYKCYKINGKEVKEHRLIMEKKLKRKLLPCEDVHHENEIKTDNSENNLKILKHGEHSRYHNLKRAAIKKATA